MIKLNINNMIGAMTNYPKDSIAIGVGATPIEEGEIVFKSDESAELRIKVNGEVYINGKQTFTNKQVHEAFLIFIKGIVK